MISKVIETLIFEGLKVYHSFKILLPACCIEYYFTLNKFYNPICCILRIYFISVIKWLNRLIYEFYIFSIYIHITVLVTCLGIFFFSSKGNLTKFISIFLKKKTCGLKRERGRERDVCEWHVQKDGEGQFSSYLTSFHTESDEISGFQIIFYFHFPTNKILV